MIESYLSICFSIHHPVTIFEQDEHTIDFGDDNEQLLSIREEAMKSAADLRHMHTLIKKGKHEN